MNRQPNNAIQQLYLSPEGRVLESCDSIFPTEAWQEQAIQPHFPVLESCWPCLFQPENQAFMEFSLPAVHLQLGKKWGIFDLYFLRVWLEKREAVYFHLVERTQFYGRLRRRQQAKFEKTLMA